MIITCAAHVNARCGASLPIVAAPKTRVSTRSVRLTTELAAQGNFAIVDPQYDNFAQTVGTSVISRAGNTPPNTPKRVANLGMSYAFAPGWQFSVGARYVSSVQGNIANTFTAPNYTLVDLALGYHFNKNVSLAARVRNATDKDYVSYVTATPLFYFGEPRAAELTSAHRFPIPEYAPKPERIANAACRQQGVDMVMVPGERRPKVLRLSVRPKEGSGLVCWLDLKPNEIELKVAKVAQYLTEIDAPDSVAQAWVSSPQPRRWVETCSKHAKTIIPGASSEASATSPLGLPLEFVSEVDLSTGWVTDDLSVRILKNGAPLAGMSVELVSGHDSRGTWRKSDSDGRVSFAAPPPGKWMLRATELHQSDAVKGSWGSHFATLVFEVLPASADSDPGRALSSRRGDEPRPVHH